MKKKNKGLIHLAALFLTLIFGWAVLAAVLDSGPGRGMMSAGPAERVSLRYITKSVNASAPGEVTYGEDGYENGAANIVTSVVTDYRMFDTFGEILVLFAAAAGVSLLMRERKRKVEREASVIVRTSVPIIMLFSLVLGFYIIIHGHLTPGGGFPGGAILASVYILQFLAFRKRPKLGVLKIIESLSGLGLLAMGLVGLFIGESLFANVLDTGRIGALFSAGSIMILYSFIGIKVAAELSSVGGDFIGE